MRLDDLGTVTDTIADRRTFARFNGEPVVALGIKRSKGASDVVVAEAVQKRIDELKVAYPDVDLKLIDTSVEFTKGNYDAAIPTLFEGATLAVIVVFLFLRDLRATIIAAISLPLSIFPAFWVMDMLGFSLNLVSFLAITLSTGILVDDAIVEIENIVRHMRMGKSPYRAALEAADEIGLAVIAISLTIIAIFAPASFMSGIAGQFFKQFGITVSVQVFFSLLAARFVTPVLAAYFLKDHHARRPAAGPHAARLHPPRDLVGAALLHHRADRLRHLRRLDLEHHAAAAGLPAGAGHRALAAGDRAAARLAARLHREDHRGDRRAPAQAAGGQERVRRRRPRAAGHLRGAPRHADHQLHAEGRPQDHASASSSSRSASDLENVPDIRFWFLDENGLRAISLIVTGVDSNIVGNVASELATQMKRIPIIANVISETSLDRPELRIQPRADLAARLGVSTESLSETIRVATIGDVGPALAKFDAGDRLMPIRVQLEDGARGDLQMLEQLRVPLGQRGERGGVPLSVVADIRLDQGPTSINRYDRERQATVAADLVGNAALGDATKKIYELPVMKSLPKGVKVSPSGDAESLNELSEGFATAITAGLMMVYAVLVLLFGTFLQPITILFSLPLSIGGAIVALLLTGKQLTTPVWIGILMLMGIVTKNAIMLVEFAIESIREGNKRDDAIIDAGMKRARPIVMTTIAMAAGMMPSALAFGAGGEFRSPMALAVIGGLVFSTVLSLVFVPAMFMMMDDLGDVLSGAIGKKLMVSERRRRDDPPRRSAARQRACGRRRKLLTAAESPGRAITALRYEA